MMLTVKNICFRHKGEKEDTLKGISFNAEKGTVTSILGPNGSGKTTVFKCLLGLWEPYKGEIYIDGNRIDNLPSKKRAKVFSVVPQEHDPPFPYSVLDIVLMGRAGHLGIFSSPGRSDYELAEMAIKTVGIEHLCERPYTAISGGERQLTLIARALAQNAPVMLLDEPTSHLDYKNQLRVLQKIKEIARKKMITIVMAVHDPNLVSFFSDAVIVIDSGRKVAEGKPDEVISEDLIEKVYGVKVKKTKIDGRAIIGPVLEGGSSC